VSGDGPIGRVVRFGVFEVDLEQRELRRSGLRVRLQDQPFQLLAALLERPGEIVTREELRSELWRGDTFVDFDHSLNAAIKRLRDALGDSAENPRFVETVARRGYRFIAPVNGRAIPVTRKIRIRDRHVGLMAGVGVAFFAALAAGGLYYRSHQQSKRLTEKDTIVLADFTNSTGDAIFDDTLKTALNVSLWQSPFLNVLSDSEVAKTLQQMTRPASTKLTPEVARELCQRAGSKAYLAGSIGSLGSQYVLGLKAVNCQNGETLTQEQVTVGGKRMPQLRVHPHLADSLRPRLGYLNCFVNFVGDKKVIVCR